MAHPRRYYFDSKGGNNSKRDKVSFDCLHRNNVWSLFGFQLFSSNNSHVLAMSFHDLVRLFDVSWHTIHGGKKVKWHSIFKITQQHTTIGRLAFYFSNAFPFLLLMSHHLGLDEFIIFILIINNMMWLLEISLDVMCLFCLQC
jgi:hypothetical protein